QNPKTPKPQNPMPSSGTRELNEAVHIHCFDIVYGALILGSIIFPITKNRSSGMSAAEEVKTTPDPQKTAMVAFSWKKPGNSV
ncbi:MAG: hypothetical protein P4L67_02345, partial [Candidatus Pacebacteria bacterium]|nr:hypothetical protein [Candidatus Paceibacterota bacterium]